VARFGVVWCGNIFTKPRIIAYWTHFCLASLERLRIWSAECSEYVSSCSTSVVAESENGHDRVERVVHVLYVAGMLVFIIGAM